MRPPTLLPILTLGATLAGAQPALVPAAEPGVTGTVEKLRAFPSKHVAPRDVEVWLPPGYAAAKGARHPVLYMHDGQNVFDPATAFGKVDWGVDEVMTRLVAAGQVRPAIVVAAWNTPLRAPEYMPQKALLGKDLSHWADRIPSGASQAPISDAYLRFLVEELKPAIDRRYATRPGREDTFVMGSSMGGLISLYALCEYPQVFGGAAGLSTHWPAADGAVIDYAERALPQAGRHRLYFDYGTAGLDALYEPFQKRMDEVLRAHGYVTGRDWVTRRFEGADHDEASWKARLDVPLRFLLGR